jgi:hypothetical protein
MRTVVWRFGLSHTSVVENGGMAEDRWTTVDLPVLEAAARLEDGDDPHFGLHALVAETDFDEGTVKQALRRLHGEYVTFTAMPGDGDPLMAVRNVRLLPSGRRATQQWPSAETTIAALVAALNEAADSAPDPEEASRLRKAASAVGGVSVDLATNIAATVLARVAGLA